MNNTRTTLKPSYLIKKTFVTILNFTFLSYSCEILAIPDLITVNIVLRISITLIVLVSLNLY